MLSQVTFPKVFLGTVYTLSWDDELVSAHSPFLDNYQLTRQPTKIYPVSEVNAMFFCT